MNRLHLSKRVIPLLFSSVNNLLPGLEVGLHVGPYLGHLLVGVDGSNDSVGLVMLEDGLGHAVVLLEAVDEGTGGVVGPLHEGLAGGVVEHGGGVGLRAKRSE